MKNSNILAAKWKRFGISQGNATGYGNLRGYENGNGVNRLRRNVDNLAFYVIFCGLAATAENSGMSPSDMVGWVKMASRNAG